MMVVVSGNTDLSLGPATNGPVSQFIQHLFQLSRGVISGALEWTIDYHNQLRADKWTVATLLALAYILQLLLHQQHFALPCV